MKSDSTKAVLEIGSDFILDATGYICALGVAPVPAPVEAKHTQTATGGVLPYTYSSSNPEMAQVDAASGEVTVANNGICNILVQDASGATAQYQLTVINAKVYIYTRQDNLLPKPVTFEDGVALGSVSVTEVAAFFDVYGVRGSAEINVVDVLGWPPELSTYWTSTSRYEEDQLLGAYVDMRFGVFGWSKVELDSFPAIIPAQASI